MSHLKKTLFLIAILSQFLWSCRKDNPRWDVGILTPLIKSSFSIKDLIGDSTVQSDSAHLVHLIFNRSLYNINVDSFIAISDTTIAKSFAIDSLKLFNININYPLTLGAIALQSGTVGALIIALNGNVFPIPAIGPLSIPKINLNIDTLFTSMTLDDGKIEISFENNLPVDITDLKFELRNTSNNNLIAVGNFPLIKSKTTESQTYSLAGQTIGAKISAEVLSFSSPGSNNVPVLIDTSNSIIAKLKVYDLRPNKATAIWPAQNIIEQYLDFNLNDLKVQLKFAKIKSGTIYLKLRSTIDDTLRFKYNLPDAVKNGQGFQIVKNLLPGTPANPSDIYEEYDFAGYDWTLSGSNKDTFNATPNTIIVSIDSTGIQKTYSKADYIIVELGFKNLKPAYALGYLGNQIFDFGPSTVDLDFFKDLNGNVAFEDIGMNVNVENNIGADVEFRVKEIKTSNTRNGNEIKLNSTIFNQPISIPRAKDNMGFPPVISSKININLDKTNSNINACFNILPDKLNYALQLVTNPLGNTSNFKDFIYDGKLLNIDFNLDVPMHFSAKGLVLEKTLEFKSENLDLERV
ncbi:MAG: hypothetical protein ABIO44_00215, partial [Saprospiraceae bacterium]